MTRADHASSKATGASVQPLWRFLAPKYWAVWIGLGAMRLVSFLPAALRAALGRGLGRLLARVQRRRRDIARANLMLCYPDLPAADRERLLTRHFESLGLALLEMSAAWWPDRRRRVSHTVEGIEHLAAAAAGQRGVILLAGHFTTIEIGTALLTQHADLDVLYRRFDNPLFDEVMRRRRRASATQVIARDDIRGMVRALTAGRTVLYMPDQADTSAQAVEARFFGVPAPTTTAPARIARLTGAAVVPFFPRRADGDRSYVLTIGRALGDFPTGDMRDDAERINAVIEDQARQTPAQYLWVHRRFKGTAGRYDGPADGTLQRA